jgi:hypothetical protein
MSTTRPECAFDLLAKDGPGLVERRDRVALALAREPRVGHGVGGEDRGQLVDQVRLGHWLSRFGGDPSSIRADLGKVKSS